MSQSTNRFTTDTQLIGLWPSAKMICTSWQMVIDYIEPKVDMAGDTIYNLEEPTIAHNLFNI